MKPAQNEDKLQIWLDFAEAHFIQHGYSNASLNRILGDLNVSKGQFYYSYDGKADLYLAVIERALHNLRPQFDTPNMYPDRAEVFWGHAISLAENISSILKQDQSMASLFRTVYHDIHAQNAVEPLVAEFNAQLEAWLKHGQEIGAVRDDIPLSLLVNMTFSLLRSFDEWFANNGETMSADEHMRLVQSSSDIFVQMLASKEFISSWKGKKK